MVKFRLRRLSVFLLAIALYICVMLNYGIRFKKDTDKYYSILWDKQSIYGKVSCEPKKNAVFLKLHKCASSTVQNIFMRYGDSRNLTFALPKIDNYLGHPSTFSKSFVPDPIKYKVTYNFLVHHSRFNLDGMQALMPSDTVYVTVVRDPVDLFESSYSYYGLSNYYRTSLDNLALLPKTTPKFEKRYMARFGTNQMLFDLGLNYTDFFNVTAIQDYIDYIDSVYSLVMVSERMDESLVLLRDLMCWEEDDVVVFKVNARNPKFKRKLTATVRNGLRVHNMADQMLYDFFSAKFEQLVKAYGRARMQRDVMSLRKRTDEWYSACVKKEDILGNLKSRVQKSETCTSLTTSEITFTNRLRDKQTFYSLEASEQASVRRKKSRGFKPMTF